ncbi:MAG: hypothetical protein ACRD6X_02745 [Pyrinomonadaceae bacterium]
MIVTDDGDTLYVKPDEVGAESEQFKAQQSRAMDATGEESLLVALGQQSIISIFSERKGIPAAMPPASAKIMRHDVSQFFTVFTKLLY